MHTVGPGLGDGVDHRAEVASRVCCIRTIHHAELLHPVLRRADALHPGDAGGVINSIQGEERSVALANATETEFQNGFRKRRLRTDGGAPAEVDRRSEQDEVNEVAAWYRQVSSLGSINYLADVGFFCGDTLHGLLHPPLLSD